MLNTITRNNSILKCALVVPTSDDLINRLDFKVDMHKINNTVVDVVYCVNEILNSIISDSRSVLSLDNIKLYEE